MQQSPKESDSYFKSAEAALSALIFLSQLFCLPVTVFMHRRWGSRFLGFNGGLAILPMLLISILYSGRNPAPLMLLILAYILRVIAARIMMIVDFFRGQVSKEHSRYQGMPLLMYLLPDWSEEVVVRFEPLIVFLVGLPIYFLNHPLGVYLILAALGWGAWQVVAYAFLMNRVMDMNDSAIEQRNFADRARDMSR